MNENLETSKDPFDLAKFIELHRCSACWSRLTRIINRDETGKAVSYTAVCENCGETMPGYVTAKYVERRQKISDLEAREVKNALRESIPWMRSKLNEREIMQSLGF